MASSSTISIGFRIQDDGNGLGQLIVDANSLRKVMQANVEETKKLKTNFINLAAVATGLREVKDILGEVTDAIKDLSALNQENITTAQLTGKTGAEMYKLRDSIKAVAEYFGKDYNETLRGVNALAKGFGITAEEAVKLMRDGMVSGADANGEFIDTLREYPRYFKEAGISAEGFIAIATNAAKQGVYSDKGVDTIKEGNLRIREMTKATAEALDAIGISSTKVQEGLRNGSITTFQVMQMVAQKLKTLPESSAKVGTAIADIFGGPGEDAGLEYIKTLADVELSMDAVKAASGELAASQEEQIAKQESIRGAFSGLIDTIASLTASFSPYLVAISSTLTSFASLVTIGNAFKALQLQKVFTLIATALKGFSVQSLVAAYRTKMLGIEMQIASTSSRAAVIGLNLLKVAIRGLLIATAVGAAIAALTFIVEKFANSSDEAAESANNLSDATDDLKEAENAYVTAAADAKQKIDKEIASLAELIKSKGDTTTAVNNLNKSYGKLFNTHKTAAEWYDVLISKGQEYCKQMGLMAQMQVLSRKLVEEEIKLASARDTIRTEEAAGRGQKRHKVKVGSTGQEKEVELRRLGSDAFEAAMKLIDPTKKKIEELKKQLDIATSRVNPNILSLPSTDPTFDYTPTPDDKPGKNKPGKNNPDKTTEKKEYTPGAADELKSIEELNKRVAYYNELKTKGTAAEKASAEEQLQNLESLKAKWDETSKGLSKPEEVNSLKTYDDLTLALKKYNEIREQGSASGRAQTEQQINKLEALKEQWDAVRAGLNVNGDVGAVTSYEQLNGALKYYTELRQSASEADQVLAHRQIQALEALKEHWDDLREQMEKPADIGSLHNIESLDSAISYYQARMKKASAEEIAVIAQVINQLEKKKKVLEAPIAIAQEKAEVADLVKLPKAELMVHIKQQGFEGLTAKINQLKKMLADLPVDSSQRKDVAELISVYENWRAAGVASFDTFKEGWSNIQGIGGGIKSISDAVEGNGDAWSKVTGIVNGFIQVYEGVKAVIGIIQMMTAATQQSTQAKQQEAVATGVGITQDLLSIPAAKAANAVKDEQISKNKEKMASDMGATATGVTAAHAGIPFVGVALAAAALAGMIALIASAKATPFANGGIVSGPTYALVGEYAGASNNPEVIAPLDKLRSILNTDGGGGTVIVGGTLRASGRDLVAVLANETRIASKSGKRTNIKL